MLFPSVGGYMLKDTKDMSVACAESLRNGSLTSATRQDW